MKNKTAAILIVLTFLAIVCYGVATSIKVKQTESDYQASVELVMNERYKEAHNLLWTLDYDYMDTLSLCRFCSIAEDYQNNFADTYHSASSFRLTFKYLPTEQNNILQSRLRVMREAFDAKREKDEEAERAEIERKIRTGVPYVGMSESRIGDTSLGQPSSKVDHNYQVKNGNQYLTNIYRFYYDGKEVFSARCMEGQVINVWDKRSSPVSSYSSYSTKSTSGDKFNASSYRNEEDFYEDHYDDFFDYYDAEDYWREHR